MEKFIEEAIKKAKDANLMSDEAHEHISKLFDRDKIKVLDEWEKAQPEEIVMLFCAIFNPMPKPILSHFVALWDLFYAAGYWARNQEALEAMADNDGKGQSAD